MNKKFFTIISASILSFSSFAMAQEAQTSQELDVNGSLPVPLIMKPIAGKQATLVTGIISIKDSFLKVPYQYRRTGILKSDVVIKSMFGDIVLIKAGAKGYWAGRFQVTDYGIQSQAEIWCFFGKDKGDRDTHQCFKENQYSSDLLYIYRAPYILDNFSSPQNNLYTSKPEYEEADVKIADNLEISYSVLSYGKKFGTIGLSVNGELANEVNFQVNENGEGTVATPVGTILIKPAAEKKQYIIALKEAAPKVEPVEKSKVDTEIKVEDIDKTISLLDVLITNLTNQIEEYKKKNDVLVNFIDVPQKPIDGVFIRDTNIVEQSFVPANAYKIKYKIADYIPAGALLFEAEYNNLHYLCWRDYDRLAKSISKPTIFDIKGICISDENKDGKYETVWKNVSFVNGTFYSPSNISNKTEIDTIENAPSVELEKVDSKQLLPEKIAFVYKGADSEGVNQEDKIVVNRLLFKWTYISNKNGSPSIGSKIYNIDEQTRKGLVKDKNDKTKVEIKRLNPDNSISIYFDDFYTQDDHYLIDYKAKTEEYSKILEAIKAKKQELIAQKDAQ